MPLRAAALTVPRMPGEMNRAAPGGVQPRHLRPRRRSSPIAAAPDDILIFEHLDGRFGLVGGSGRGAGWAGIVDLAVGDPSLVERAWRFGTPVRQAGSTPRHVAGPYHARHAVAVPVGDRHVVVLGGATPIAGSDADVVRAAAAAVDRLTAVPADKLLADELELVHALRALMAYRAERVRDTMRHIATVAGSALSCEVVLVRLEHADGAVVEAIGRDPIEPCAPDSAADQHLASVARTATAILDQAGGPDGVFGSAVASHLTLPIGSEPVLGAIALGHAADRPRGFTSLCQRIGRAVAEAAELLLSQAVAREQLAADRDRLARMSATDALTGVANRRSWDDEVQRSTAADAGGQAQVISIDVDGLKQMNDRYGHPAGDAFVRATADLLVASVRSADFVARIGGDEFVVLLREADAAAAERVRRRIRRTEGKLRVTDQALPLRVSLGVATVVDGDLEAARRVADARMYADKRRRHARAASAGRGPRRGLRAA